MKNKILVLMAISLSCLLLQSCGQKNTADSKTLQKDSLFVEVPEDGKLTDTKGDVRPTTATTTVAFIDLTEMTVKVTDTTITVTITVADLPDQFTYNQARPGQLEYSWQIFFDIDNNSKKSADDLLLDLVHVRKPKTQEAQGALLEFAKPSFHIIEEAHGTGFHSGRFLGEENINATVSEHTITFSVDKSSHVKLNKITSSTKVRFEAQYIDSSNNSFSDSYPNAQPKFSAGDSRHSAFVEVPKDGKLTDAKGDVLRSATATTNVAFIDLTEMTVNVTDNNITVTMTVADLPDQFIYNKARPNQLEYSWKVIFDTDSNSKTIVGDLALYLAYGSHSEAQEAKGALLDFAKPDFRVVTKATDSGFSDTSFLDDKISTTVSDNTIIFSVDKSSHVKLNKITSSTKVRFEAYYIDANNNSFSDFYPNADD